MLPGLAAAHARRLLGDDVGASARLLVVGLDQDPLTVVGSGQAESAGELVPVEGEGDVVRVMALATAVTDLILAAVDAPD